MPGPAGRRDATVRDRGFFRGWVAAVTHRRVAALLAAVAALGRRSPSRSFSMRPRWSSARRRAAPRPAPRIFWPTASVPGVTGPLPSWSTAPARRAAGGAGQPARSAALPDVAAVTAAAARTRTARPRWSPCIPRPGRTAQATEHLVHDLRDRCSAARTAPASTSPGTTAVSVDVSTEARPTRCRSTWCSSSGSRSCCWCWSSARSWCRWSACSASCSPSAPRSAPPSRCSSGAGSPALVNLESTGPLLSLDADPRDRHPVRPGDGLPGLPGLADARGARARRARRCEAIAHRLPAGRPGRGRRRGDHVLGLRRASSPAATPRSSRSRSRWPSGILFDAVVVRMIADAGGAGAAGRARPGGCRAGCAGCPRSTSRARRSTSRGCGRTSTNWPVPAPPPDSDPARAVRVARPVDSQRPTRLFAADTQLGDPWRTSRSRSAAEP